MRKPRADGVGFPVWTSAIIAEPMRRKIPLVLLPAVAVLALAPASASAKGCASVKTDGGQTRVDKITTSAGACSAAQRVAKKFAQTRVAPPGYTCDERLRSKSPPFKADVSCSGKQRKITFKVTWNGQFPLPAAPALPVTG